MLQKQDNHALENPYFRRAVASGRSEVYITWSKNDLSISFPFFKFDKPRDLSFSEKTTHSNGSFFCVTIIMYSKRLESIEQDKVELHYL